MTEQPMPALFIGHGSPMNAIEDNEFSLTWAQLGKNLPRPKAIVCISAHWETRGTWVTAAPNPQTIHDFMGFPKALFEMQYPAPGSPDLAKQVSDIITHTEVMQDTRWGLDHGTWSVLCRMFPEANIPVIQLSLNRLQGSRFHYELGKHLSTLRDEQILVFGSGNIVHNLARMVWNGAAFDWAVKYDQLIKQNILEDDHDAIVEYEKHGQMAALAVNSAEHYLPLLYVLGMKQKDDPVTFFAEKITAGSISMRCVQIG